MWLYLYVENRWYRVLGEVVEGAQRLIVSSACAKWCEEQYDGSEEMYNLKIYIRSQTLRTHQSNG